MYMKYEQFTVGMNIKRANVRGPASVVTAVTHYYIVAVSPDHGTFRIYPHGCAAWVLAL